MATAAELFDRIGSTDLQGDAPVRLGTSVVLGGSVAGLLAARVLADHSDDVVIVERDPSGGDDRPRRGVPQGSQLHAMLPGGARQLERWFPGFTADALAAGAQTARPEQRINFLDGRRLVRGSDEVLLTATRPLLERVIRGRLLELPNVRVITGRVTGVEFGESAATAVDYEAESGPARQGADLVVDAMGRASRLSEWLGEAGWDRPPLIRQTININYATALFKREPGVPPWNAVQALCSPEAGGDLGGAAMVAVEDDRWIILMGGYGDCRPGHTAEDFLRRCREEFPEQFGRVAEQELLELKTYHQADSRRRDFFRTRKFPARLVVVGDAVASFNPIYGQGMSVAALHASCLSMYLRSGPALDSPARHFFELQRVVDDAAWDLSTSGDLARKSVPGPRPSGFPLMHWLSNRITSAMATDAVVARVFFEVTFMTRHPAELARPVLLARALRAGLRRRPAPAPTLADMPV
ncbi:FAD-dependent oxidoreductase [Actinoplanes sp. NPDC051411]|jgi:2-polyprenyl-6-methoxyphenol hydroxylase-like FAD-dependent oxidoreductase|uniref:FAD-dependent oxidoreductase n=1 Tax=Actinoplanes sp. NPDC051411 TaxID=3155522 RepID=UPI00342D7F27